MSLPKNALGFAKLDDTGSSHYVPVIVIGCDTDGVDVRKQKVTHLAGGAYAFEDVPSTVGLKERVNHYDIVLPVYHERDEDEPRSPMFIGLEGRGMFTPNVERTALKKCCLTEGYFKCVNARAYCVVPAHRSASVGTESLYLNLLGVDLSADVYSPDELQDVFLRAEGDGRCYLAIDDLSSDIKRIGRWQTVENAALKKQIVSLEKQIVSLDKQIVSLKEKRLQGDALYTAAAADVAAGATEGATAAEAPPLKTRRKAPGDEKANSAKEQVLRNLADILDTVE